MSGPVLLATSWDDGSPLDVRIADTLEDFGFVGTFYAFTGPDGRRLIDDWDLARIGRKHELGAHGRSHRIFPELPPSALADEIHWAVEEMSRFGNVGDVVAPPSGKIDAATRRFIGHLGFAVRTGAIVGIGIIQQQFPGGNLSAVSIHVEDDHPEQPVPPTIPNRVIARRTYTKRSPEDRFRQMLVAEVEQHRYVHVWGAFGGNPSASIFGVH